MDIFQGGIILSLIGLLIALGLMVILPGISVVSLYFAITYTNEIVFDIEKKKRQEKINNLVGKLKSELLININPKDNKIIDRDKLCLYDDMLNYNIKEPNKIWFTNDEKEGMLKNILFSINKKVNFTKYSNGFIVEEIKDSIDEEIFNLNSNLNEFKNYISYYNSKKEEIHKAIVNRINYYNFEYNSAVIGRKGEEYVNSELSLYENFYNLEGIRLEIEDANSIKHSIENDNIIVCKYGVFVLEVKNYGLLGNYDIKIERDGRWVKCYRNSNKSEVMKSATSQNNRHIIYLNKFINKILNRSMADYIEADGIVVIANDVVRISNESFNQKVYRVQEIYQYIKSRNVVLTQDEVEKIRQALIKHNLPQKKFPMNDYKDEIINNYNAFKKFDKMVKKDIETLKKYNELISNIR